MQEKAAAILRKVLPTSVGVPAYLDQVLHKPCGAFAGATATSLLPFPDMASSSFLRLSMVRIPSAASRHNCPTRPDVVYEKLPGLLSSENEQGADDALTLTSIQVIFLLPPPVEGFTEANSAISFVGALARSCSLYSRKRSQPASELVIHASFFSSTRDEFLWTHDSDASFRKQLSVSADAVRQAAALVDQPCNECHTDSMVSRAQQLVQDLSRHQDVKGQVTMHKCCVGEDLDKEGFGGIYGVGKAAERPPALVVLKYTPEGESEETVAWVGKGIVYDTGGLSIKTKTGMPGMKRDMGGSAAILEAFRAVCLLGSKKTVYAVLCLAENAVGSPATRPDDIHILYSGLSVEINNTDAEGRLVVGDGVAYVSKHLNVDVVLDMCTLTGAQGIATGQRHSAIVCNEETMEDCAVRAGRQTGDLCHPMPYSPELFTVEFKSSVADMKNSVKNRNNAQPSCAGHFIGSHLVDYQ